jgi:hypothetical protein
MVRKNSITTLAMTRGVTSLRVGSVPRARMASICSVTFIEPSSEAMPEALRPDTIRPVNTGPSSFTMDSATRVPVIETAPNSCSEVSDCSASTHPVKKPDKMTIGREPMPMESICVKMSAQ